MWALKMLFGLAGSLVSLGMFTFALDLILTSAHTLAILRDDFSLTASFALQAASGTQATGRNSLDW